jgi:hypothetical protein
VGLVGGCSTGLLRPAWGAFSSTARMDPMHPWFGQYSQEQIAQMVAGQAAEPAPVKGNIDAETIRQLNEIANRRRTPTEDPVMAIPEYVPSNEELEGLHHRALFFLDGLEQNHLIESVSVQSPFLWFLGHRVYVVPSIGSGPNFMYEPWFKGEEEWEKRGVFANAYRALEHVYFMVMRARVHQLVGSAK